VGAVVFRELTMYRRYWKSTTFSSVVEPTIYLLAFGFGFGSLVAQVAGYDYVDFVGTGIVATAVLFSSAFPGMFGTFVKRHFQKTYDAMLAAPVDTEEVVTAEAFYIGMRSGIYGVVPMLVAILFGLEPSWGMLLVPLIGVLTGFGFAAFGIWISGIVPSIDSFGYVISRC
jgi:lipooligosaccharide transport system permease protein